MASTTPLSNGRSYRPILTNLDKISEQKQKNPEPAGVFLEPFKQIS
jgi:hypothetical protein